MSYKLGFAKTALKEWHRLDGNLRQQFKKKLADRLEQPHILSARLSGQNKNRYKIKLRNAGYRLVYEVRDSQLLVVVIAIGKRDKLKAYKAAAKR